MKKIYKNKVFQVFICLIIALIIYGIIILINDYRDFVKLNIKKNTNSIFTLKDFTVSNLNYGDLDKTAITIFGKPNKIEKFKDGKQKYKSYYYDGLELTFKNESNSYIFMKAIVTSDKYLVSRNIKIGDRISDTINKYFIENTTGNYMYKNYKEKNIDGKTIKDNVFLAHREKNLVYYLYMDAPYKKTYASLKDDIAQLTMKVSLGKVKRIELMYGPLED